MALSITGLTYIRLHVNGYYLYYTIFMCVNSSIIRDGQPRARRALHLFWNGIIYCACTSSHAHVPIA